MKRLVTIFAILTLTISASCGSSSAPGDTSPTEAKVLALGGALSAMVNQWVCTAGLAQLITGEGITSPYEATRTINSLDIGLLGDDDDLFTFDATFSTAESELVTLTIDCSYLSTMSEYPIDAGETISGATITFDGTDYVLNITVADDASSGSVSGTAQVAGDGVVESVDFTGASSCTEASISITSPEAKSGTASFNSASIGYFEEEGTLNVSFIGSVTVGYGGDIYSCPILASYTGPGEGEQGDTGIGTFTITSASCTEQ